MLYTESGWGKTTQIGNLAEWLFKETGKRTRLLSASGGGWACIQSIVDAGIIDPVAIGEQDYLMEKLIRAYTRGWWPEEPSDPSSILLPPPHFKDREAAKNWKHGYQSQDAWDSFGLWAFDGLGEMCAKLMTHLQEKAAGGMNVTADSKVACTYTDGATKFGGRTQGMWGEIQGRAEQAVANAKTAFPDRIVLWTTLVDKGEDDVTKKATYGPEIIGHAKTASSVAWCENCFHGFHQEPSKGEASLKKQMWLKPHYDRFGIPYLAKIAVDGYYSEQAPDVLEGEDLTLKVGCSTGLVKVMELISEAEAQAKERLK